MTTTAVPRHPPIVGAPRVLVAAHTHKFFAPLRAELERHGAVVRYDRWEWHDRHDVECTRKLTAWADVLVAGWCLGNAVFLARERRADQRLLVQLHRFELETPFPHELDIDAVDRVIVPAPHIAEEACERFGWPAEKVLALPNPVAVDQYDRPKRPAAATTLGLIGYDRPLKRLDFALDLLAELRRDDPRFTLTVKGAPSRARDARAYEAEQHERIANDPLLSEAVSFEPFGADVSEWLTGVGVILSLSDIESFHLALAEGMASRALPVIRRRAGVDRLWPERWIHDDVASMATAIRRAIDGADPTADWRAEGERARAFVARHYALEDVGVAWARLVGLEPETAA